MSAAEKSAEQGDAQPEPQRVVILAGDTGLGWAGNAGWTPDVSRWRVYPLDGTEKAAKRLQRALDTAQDHAGEHQAVTRPAPTV